MPSLPLPSVSIQNLLPHQVIDVYKFRTLFYLRLHNDMVPRIINTSSHRRGVWGNVCSVDQRS